MPDKPRSRKLASALARLERGWQELADLLKSPTPVEERALVVEPPPPPHLFGEETGPPRQPAAAENAPAAPPGDMEPSPLGPQEEQPGDDRQAGLLARLEYLERQNRRLKRYGAFMLGLLGLMLAGLLFWFFRPQPPGPLVVESLEVRDPKGVIRAWLGDKQGQAELDLRDRQGKRRAALSLGPDGSPGLALYDQNQRLRAALNLGPDGVPRLDLQNKLDLVDPTAPAAPPESGESPAAAAETAFLGSKTSNRYHYPTCKWAQKIRPERLIIFKSVEEAQARRYIPCPVCKPPPLRQ